MATKFGTSFATKQDQTKTWSTIWIFLRLTGATSGCFPGPGIWLSSWPLSVTEYPEPSWPCLEVTNWRPGNNHFDLVTMKSGSTKHTVIGLNYLDLPGTVYIPYIMHGSVATRVVFCTFEVHTIDIIQIGSSVYTIVCLGLPSIDCVGFFIGE